MGNVYELGIATTEVEATRLKVLNFPLEASKKLLLKCGIRGKKVLDIGAGPSISLEEFVQELGGYYLACDISSTFLLERKKVGFSQTVQVDNTSLPFADDSFDFTHTRIVLAHLSFERRARAIKESVRVASQKSLMLEWNWKTFKGGEAISEFVNWSLKFFEQTGFNPFLGESLETEVINVVDKQPVNEYIFRRKPGNYYHEVMPLAETFLSVGKKLKGKKFESGFIDQLESLIGFLNEEKNKQTFTPPDLVAVEVIKYDNK